MSDSGPPASAPTIAFAAGALTISVVALLMLGFVAARVGPLLLWEQLFGRDAVELPDDVLRDLVAIDAVVGNADNPTGARRHDTILVRPDPELGYALRPSRRILATMLAPANSLNLDPPVVYRLEGSPLSEPVRRFLSEQGRLSYSYGIDSRGFRVTVPRIEAARRILMLGDSALFGSGVDDQATVASQLQLSLGRRAEVLNAGVGGYSGEQVLAAARKLLGAGEYDALVYLAHQNDFNDEDDVPSLDAAAAVLDGFAALRERLASGAGVVALLTQMEYTTREILGAYGFSREQIEATHALRREMARRANAAGFAFVDWTDIAEAQVGVQGSLFALFGLYVDHGHLSPLGNRLLARALFEALEPATAEGS